MPTMNVSLTPKLASFVESEVETGDYATASEVVRAALRVAAHDRRIEQEKTELLRREVARGIADADAGRMSSRTASDIARSLAAERG